jgi:hypothetical protein
MLEIAQEELIGRSFFNAPSGKRIDLRVCQTSGIGVARRHGGQPSQYQPLKFEHGRSVEGFDILGLRDGCPDPGYIAVGIRTLIDVLAKECGRRNLARADGALDREVGPLRAGSPRRSSSLRMTGPPLLRPLYVGCARVLRTLWRAYPARPRRPKALDHCPCFRSTARHLLDNLRCCC